MNYADMSDAELDHAIAMGSMNAWSGADLEALRAEKARRAAARMAPPVEADDQAAQNDAAATPIVPDAEVKPRVIVPPQKDPRTQYRDDLVTAGWSEEQADRFTEQEAGKPHPFAIPANIDSERAAVGRAAERDARHSASEAYWKDVYGHNDEPPMSTSFEMRDTGSGRLPDFGGGDTDMVDGVEVPTVDLGDGKRRYSFRDLRLAKEAAENARYAEMVSRSAQEDLAAYGDRQMVRYTYGPDGQVTGTEYVSPSTLTPEQARQQANLISRRGMEGRQQRQNAALRNRPGLRDLEAKEAQRRNLRSDMARLAGGSQNLNSGNNAFFQALAMLSPDEQRQAMTQMMPMDPVRAQVEGRQLDMAGRMAQNAVTAFLTNNPNATPEQANMLRLQMEAKEEDLPPAAAAARERARSGSVRASSRAGQRLLQDIEERVIGPYATPAEVDAAVKEAVDAGMPQEDADGHFGRRRSWDSWMGGSVPAHAINVLYPFLPPGIANAAGSLFPGNAPPR